MVMADLGAEGRGGAPAFDPCHPLRVNAVASVPHFAVSCFCGTQRAIRNPKACESFGQGQKVFAAIAMAHGSLLLQERDGQILNRGLRFARKTAAMVR